MSPKTGHLRVVGGTNVTAGQPIGNAQTTHREMRYRIVAVQYGTLVPACFAVYHTAAEAYQIAAKLRERHNRLYVVRPIAKLVK